MNFAFLSGGAGVPVEHFVRPLSLSCLSVAAGWIVARGESGHSAGRLNLGAKGAGNTAEQIFDLLVLGFNTLVFNVCGGLLGMISGTAGVGAGAFDQGGEGVAGAAGARSLQSISGCKICSHCPRSENRAPKKRGARAAFHNNTAHDQTMSKPRCPQCGLTSTIDCQEEGCPGVAGFYPSTWARPLIQMAADLERYEALIVKLSDCMDGMTCFDECGQVARLICDEAQKIQKKRGGA